MTVVDLHEKLSRFSDHWSPKVVARMNDYEVKVVKLKGDFVWHTHDDTDELFLVIEGDLTIQLRDGDVQLREGQLYVVPRGVEHRPVTDGEVAVMLIEPAGVVNTGDVGGDLTAAYDDSLLPEATSPATSERVPRPWSDHDISELATWVDSRDFGVAYLDPATGEVWPAFEGGDPLGPDGEPVDVEETDWIALGGASSHEAYQDMEDFARAVGDQRASQRLLAALDGPRPFRRFGDAAWHLPEELGRAWSKYRELGAELRALEWLVDTGLVGEQDVTEARSAREAAARAILDSVG